MKEKILIISNCHDCCYHDYSDGGNLECAYDTENPVDVSDENYMPDLCPLSDASSIAKLRKALADLVGASTKGELEGMELAVRTMPGVEQDKIAALNAIHALLETL